MREDGAQRPEGSANASPDIPARTLKDILLRVYRAIDDDRILINAAGVTYYALLALFPAIAALVSIYGLFADPGTIAQQVGSLSGILPGGGVTVIRDQLTNVAAHGGSSLTLGFVVGLGVSLWSANGGMKGLFDALNVVYDEHEKRSLLRRNAVTLAFTLAMIAFAVVAIICVVAIPALLNHLPGFVATVAGIARWPVIAVLAAIALALIYRYGPSREHAELRWIGWGTFSAAVLWLAVSALFSYYAANFGAFNKTYGSLGAVIGFMLWIWLSVIVILLGGKLNAEIEHRRDTGGTARAGGAAGARNGAAAVDPHPVC